MRKSFFELRKTIEYRKQLKFCFYIVALQNEWVISYTCMIPFSLYIIEPSLKEKI